MMNDEDTDALRTLDPLTDMEMILVKSIEEREVSEMSPITDIALTAEWRPLLQTEQAVRLLTIVKMTLPVIIEELREVSKAQVLLDHTGPRSLDQAD